MNVVTRAAARFHTGGRLDERRDGGGAGAGARDRTDGVGEQRFLHVGHVALFIDHAGAGGRADEGADGVEARLANGFTCRKMALPAQ